MDIALIGYGKMGKEIDSIAKRRGHNIVITINENNREDFTVENLKKVDVAIEFTNSKVAYNNYLKCFEADIPVVSGTTGWLDKLDKVKEICYNQNKSFFYASNFSFGVNIFFELNKKLAKLMAAFPDYSVDIEEIHHIHKLDAPSGTAITLAEDIIKNHPVKKKWVNYATDIPEKLSVICKRHGSVPGTHSVMWCSDIDEITIKHKAKSRKGFALGAVLSAEFIKNKKGFFGMKDLLTL